MGDTFGRIDVTQALWRLSTALLLLAVAVSLRWWWRRRKGKDPHCRRCGYNLSGNASAVCPECGSQLSSARSIALGAPRPAGARPYIVALLLASAAGVAAVNRSHVLRRVNWYGYVPFEWVLADSRSTDTSVALGAWTELDRRETAGKLSGSQRKAMIDRALADTAAAPMGFGSNIIRFESLGSKRGRQGFYWPDAYRIEGVTGGTGPTPAPPLPGVRRQRLETVIVPLLLLEQRSGEMDARQASSYLSHVAELFLQVRPKVRRGSAIPYFHSINEYQPYCTSPRAAELMIDGKLVPEAPTSTGQVRDLPSSSLAPGQHQLTVNYYFRSIDAQAVKLTKSAAFDITDGPTAQVDPKEEGSAPWGGDADAFIYTAPDGHTEFGCCMGLTNKSKTLPAVSEVLARTPEREVRLGVVALPPHYCTTGFVILRDAPKWYPDRVQLVVRSSAAAAERTLGVMTIAANEFTYSVPVRKATKIDYTKLPVPEVTFEP